MNSRTIKLDYRSIHLPGVGVIKHFFKYSLMLSTNNLECLSLAKLFGLSVAFSSNALVYILFKYSLMPCMNKLLCWSIAKLLGLSVAFSSNARAYILWVGSGKC
jgi:hypothetical protein